MADTLPSESILYNLNAIQDMISDAYTCDETQLVGDLIASFDLSPKNKAQVQSRAAAIINELRSNDAGKALVDQFLLQYGLSTPEGVLLMRLAEATLRTPDRYTRNKLIRDRLLAGNWSAHAGKSRSFIVNAATLGLMLAKGWVQVSGGAQGNSVFARIGDRVLSAAVSQAMVLMGEHYILGRSIDQALQKSKSLASQGFCFSYDMLGEAAMTSADAERYFRNYHDAMKALADAGRQDSGLSVKLSALHPRYEIAKADTCVPMLTQRVKTLALMAKSSGLSLAIDAEEAERLEVSMQVISRLLEDPDLEGWDGLSIVVQAYQRRARPVLKWLIGMARNCDRRIGVRLVKGAYWDSEIKRAQELGLSSYPVFTRKENTDVSYLACARLLLANHDAVFPQFATHNALTAAAILEIAPDEAVYEFQCLHGMGEDLHVRLMKEAGRPSRIYAPVGEHKELLPYLVRRLLENGANSSFVNQLSNPDINLNDLIEHPTDLAASNTSVSHPALPSPQDHLNGERLSAAGLDLTQDRILNQVSTWIASPLSLTAGSSNENDDAARVLYNPACPKEAVGRVYVSTNPDVQRALDTAAQSTWGQTPTSARAEALRKTADLIEAKTDHLLPILVREAGKTLLDAVGEIREAVDFCRYYADRCEDKAFQSRAPLGTMACISPWNFPLAIFLGQIVASLAAGNSVVAKPAEQTPLIAVEAHRMMLEAGVSGDALQLVFGGGDVGALLTASAQTAGICFTGSTATAKKISATLAESGRGSAAFIAETGGINAMVVDSTALLEQAVQDTVDSAFQSAGQRCSACRIVCVQDDVADDFIEMLRGAMNELSLGDPSDPNTDVGPVIDAVSAARLRDYIGQTKSSAKQVIETEQDVEFESDLFIAPIAFEMNAVSDVTDEVFGPVLHIVRFKATAYEDLINEINDLGYGLTLGLHTRIDSRIAKTASLAKVGNIYVNRNQIGAVVGVQPFGGEGLSGTGPKAGGPHYLYRLSKDASSQSADLQRSTALPLISRDAPTDSDAVLNRANKAQQAWAQMNRRRVFVKASAKLGEVDGDAARTLDQLLGSLPSERTELPGPTGEENTLRLAPRGVLLARIDGCDLREIEGVLKALAAGNGVLIDASTSHRSLIDSIVKSLEMAGLPEHAVTFVPSDTVTHWLGREIDGVVAAPTVISLLSYVAAVRGGPILPLITPCDPLHRYCVERTLTVDTTAAGGNAALLASI